MGPREPQQIGIPFPSAGERVAHLLEQRDRYGFSYLHVHAGQMKNFAPVVARLTGQ